MIFVDSGAFLARYLARDQYHRRALPIWEDIGRGDEPCVTSNFVLAETLTLLGRRAGYAFAADTAHHLYTSRVLQIIRPEIEHEVEALSFFEKFADQRVSFTDCISFALIRARRIERAFSFDRHFLLAGFEILA